LNSKRTYIADMEVRHGHTVTVLGSDRVQGANFTVERGAASALPLRRAERAAVNMDWGFDDEGEAPARESSEIEVVQEAGDSDEETGDHEHANGHSEGEDNGARRGRRRRRRGRGGRDRGEDRERYASEPRDSNDASAAPGAPHDTDDADEGTFEVDGLGEQPSVGEAAQADQADGDSQGDRPNKRRRRGRRGGRRGRERGRGESGDVSADAADGNADEGDAPEADDDETPDVADIAVVAPEPSPPRRSGRGSQARENAKDHSKDQSGARAETATRRPRRVWDAPAAANGADDAAPSAPVPPSAIETSPSLAAVTVAEKPAAAPAAPSRRRHETDSSEPRIERVVVGPGEENGDADNSAATAAPQRKGWWQRKFGGE
jgi:ribonuclease E